ncbi:copper homeostasis CutC domain-containing protein [Mycena amicta]|nr:copper homeostasis CutC domain-containing protein [Mycena amicta]
MVRPRIGDFLYMMVQDIRLFKQNGVAGVVLGVLKANGRVDVDATQRLVREALPLQVCFHRAFDMTRDPNEALRDLVSIEGITRILTSGHGQTAPEALDALKSLCRLTTGGLSILPGSGINSETVRPVLDALLPLGIKELHLSGGGWVGGGMLYRRDNMGMGSGESEWSIWVTSEAKVRNVRHVADEVWGEARGM